MDGAKLATDTIDIRKDCDRQAYCKGRSTQGIECGPYCNENPGNSRILDM